ncbi:hypothetical protein KS4_31400 [Poriferisphaera corsica]|uniref:Uncharacterized protein n=1 Tax=Poriferisphaera corsica TaxID=2528020 RepID=A0A517YXV9_9BACT|nr:hypothetical protein KS4_31400 [Poriferisphaera corsica]
MFYVEELKDGAFGDAEEAEPCGEVDMDDEIGGGEAFGEEYGCVIGVDDPLGLLDNGGEDWVAFFSWCENPVFVPIDIVEVVEGEVEFLGELFGECGLATAATSDDGDAVEGG